MVLHNYVHVLTACDRVNLIQDGVIALDKPTAETSVEELTEIVVEEYRRARASGREPPAVEPWPRVRTASIGVDFGTLSGRAVVVRVERRRGAGLGGPRVPARRDRRATLPATGEQLPPALGAAGPRRLARRAARRRCRRRVAARGRRARRRSSAIGTDFTACTPLPVLADGTPLCRLAELRAAARTPSRSCGSTTPRSRRPTASTRSPRERGEPWLARYGGRISSEWEFAKALQVLEEDPEVYDAHGPLDRGRRLDRLAALRRRDAQRLHRRLQGDPPGRRATRRDDYLRALEPAFAGFVADKLEHPLSPLGGRAGGLTARGRRRGPGCPRASRSPSATSTRTSPRRPRSAIEPGQMLAIMGTSTCHVMNGDALAEVPGMCGVVDGGIVPGPVGLRGRARAASATSSAGSSTTPCRRATTTRRARAGSTCTSTCPSSRPSRRSARTGSSRSTGTTATARCSSTTSSAALIVGLTLATRAEDIYRALVEATAFGTREILETFAAAGVPVTRVLRRRRPAQEPVRHADLRRRRCACRCT